MDWSLEEDPKKISLKEQTSLLVFLDHCFTSMEVDLIRNQIQRLVSVSFTFYIKQPFNSGKRHCTSFVVKFIRNQIQRLVLVS